MALLKKVLRIQQGCYVNIYTLLHRVCDPEFSAVYDIQEDNDGIEMLNVI
jgi:hypothetical protein